MGLRTICRPVERSDEYIGGDLWGSSPHRQWELTLLSEFLPIWKRCILVHFFLYHIRESSSWTWILESSSSFSFCTCSRREHLGIGGTGLYGQVWSSCHPAHSVKVLNETSSIDSVHSLASSFLISPTDSWRKRRCSFYVGCQTSIPCWRHSDRIIILWLVSIINWDKVSHEYQSGARYHLKRRGQLLTVSQDAVKLVPSLACIFRLDCHNSLLELSRFSSGEYWSSHCTGGSPSIAEAH